MLESKRKSKIILDIEKYFCKFKTTFYEWLKMDFKKYIIFLPLL